MKITRIANRTNKPVEYQHLADGCAVEWYHGLCVGDAARSEASFHVEADIVNGSQYTYDLELSPAEVLTA